MKIAQALKVALKKALSLQFGEVSTDGGTLYFDGELEVGTEVFVEGEDAEMKPAADGNYTADNGDVIVVEGGKVTEIRKKEEEKPDEAKTSEQPAEEPAEEPADEPAENVEAADVEEPAAEAADETAAEPEGTESLEDKVARLEGLVNNYVEGLEKIINAIAALENRIAEAENKIAALDSTPAAPEAEVEVEESTPKSRISYLRKN